MTLDDHRADSSMDLAFKPHAAAIVAFVFFYCADMILQHLGDLLHEKKPDPNAFNRMRNYSLSVLHAAATGTVSLLYLMVFRDLLEDIVSAEKESAYIILGFSTGYFLHDIYHNFCSGICLRSVEIIAHHLTAVGCFVVVITYRILLPYALFGLLMELNSIFLHGRQIMLYLNVNPKSFLYRVNFKANVGSFIVFRLCLSMGLFYWAISNRNRLPNLVCSLLIFSLTVFTVMNFVLFWRVLASEKRIVEEYEKRHKVDPPYSNGDAIVYENGNSNALKSQ